MRTRRLIGAALMGVLLVLSLTVTAQTPGPYAAQVQQAIRSLLAGTSGSFSRITVTTSGTLGLQMAPVTGLAVVTGVGAGSLPAGVYTITVTAYDPAGGETTGPTAVACTTVGANLRCRVSWNAVQGAYGYLVWSSLVGVTTPSRYFAVASTVLTYDLDTLAGATAATLPTVNTAHRVRFGSSSGNWFNSPPNEIPAAS